MATLPVLLAALLLTVHGVRAASLPPAGADPEPPPAVSATALLIEGAMRAWQDGRLRVAIRNLDPVLVDPYLSDGEYIQAWMLLGTCQFLLGDEQAAKAGFTNVLAVAPQLEPKEGVFPPEVVSFFRRVREVNAAHAAPAAAPSAPEDPDRRARRKEVAALREVLRRDPGNYQTLVYLGHAHFALGEARPAAEAYLQALAIDNRDPSVWSDLGIMYRQLKDVGRTVESFRRAMATDPGHAASRMNLGLVLFHDLGDREGALQAWEELLRLEPEGPRADRVRPLVEELRRTRDGGR
jgi:tetratricopeptide (TPR) repeat protein